MTIETRREWFRTMAALGAGSLVDALIPRVLTGRAWQQPTQDRTAAFRAQIGAVPIQTQRLGDQLTLLSGPGGNVVVLHGSDGLIVVDTFVAPAWPKLEQALAALGAPVKYVINTHWHFADTDVTVRFVHANVLHAGDVFFNGRYPYIDGNTGGRVDGMIEASNRLLHEAEADTRIVPGHGPLATRADLVKYRDMLSTAADRVGKLKASGKSLEESIAAKPLTDLDGDWGSGRYKGDDFVRIVYLTL